MVPVSRVAWRRVAAALLVACVTALAGSAAQAQQAGEGEVLRMAVAFPFDHLDPIQQFSGGFDGVSENLVRINLDGEVELTLLEALEQTSPTSWVLTLEPGITFQNGKPVDGEAVAAALRRQLAGRQAAADAIPGATVEATGDLEVTITTDAPVPLLPYALAVFRDFPIYDVEAIEGAADTGPAIAGLGAFTSPYAVVELTDTRMILERYDGYWQGRPPLAGVEFSVVPDVQARLAAVEAGEIDVATEMNVPEINRLFASDSGSGDIRLNKSEAPTGVIRLYLDTTEPPFDDPKVRLAVSHALDYQVIATDFLEGSSDPGTGLLPDTLPQAIANQVTDTEQAAALLDQAGWTAGPDGTRSKDGTPLVIHLLLYSEREQFQSVALAMQDQLGALGIGVEITEQPYDIKMYEDLPRWDAAFLFDFSVSGSGVPDTGLPTYLHTGGFANFGKISDPELDMLLDDLVTAGDDHGKRDDLLRQIQQVAIAEQAYVIHIAYERDGSVVGPGWHSYRPSQGSYNSVSVTFETQPG